MNQAGDRVEHLVQDVILVNTPNSSFFFSLSLRTLDTVMSLLLQTCDSQLRSCMKVEVAVPNSPFGLCGREATMSRCRQVLVHVVACAKIDW